MLTCILINVVIFLDILVILALVVTFIHADRTVQREVSKQGKRELKPLGIIALNIVACVLLVHFLCGDNELYHRFVEKRHVCLI